MRHVANNLSSSSGSGLAWGLLATTGGGLATLVVAGLLAGRLGLPLGGVLLPGAALLGMLPGGLRLLGRRWQLYPAQLAATGVAFVLVAGFGLWLAWPALLPLGYSVDAVHHTQLIEWLATHQALPPQTDDAQQALGEMVDYPPGFALLVVTLAELLKRPALDLLYPTAALLGGLIAALVVVLASTGIHPGTTRRLGFAALVLPTILLLTQRSYLLEAYIDHSYYTMLFGIFLVLLACTWPIHTRQLSPLVATEFGVVLAALLGVYPLWAPIPALVALVLWGREGRRAVDGGRWTVDGGQASVFRLPSSVAGLLSLLLAFAPAVMVAWLDTRLRLAGGQAVLAHEGLVTLPQLTRLAPLVLALAAALVLWRSQARRLLLPAALTLVYTLGLTVAAWQGLVASYHAYKLLFLLTPLAAALVGGAALVSASRQLSVATQQATGRPGSSASSGNLQSTIYNLQSATVGVLALLIGLSAAIQPSGPPVVQLLTPDLVAAARWLRHEQPREARRALLVGTPAGTLNYWMAVGLLGQSRSKAGQALRSLRETPPTPEGWVMDAGLPPVAILSGSTPPPGATVLAQFGTALVVQRNGSLDVADNNPLLIRYRVFSEAGRIKSAFELLQPVAGRLPTLELHLSQAGQAVADFALVPEANRTRMQYLGLDLLPDLSTTGYINRSSYPQYPAPANPQAGTFELTLRLALDGVTVDQRHLANFEWQVGDGFAQLAGTSGEFVYLKRASTTAELQPLALALSDTLALSGWNAPAYAAPGDTLDLALLWQARQAQGQALDLHVQLVDEAGQVLASSTAAPQGGFYPTWRWRPGEAVLDTRQFQLPNDTVPGSYRVLVALDGQPALVIGQVTVVGLAAQRDGGS